MIRLFKIAGILILLFKNTQLCAQKDTIPPQIIILGDTLCIEPNSIWAENIQILDNQTDSAEIIVIKTWLNNIPVNTNVLSTYTVTYQAIDSSGNIAIKTVNYKVMDCIAPIITFIRDTLCFELDEPVDPNLLIKNILKSDNYYSSNDLIIEIVNSNINPQQLGLYKVTFRTTDPSGNTSSEITLPVFVNVSCNRHYGKIDQFSDFQFKIYPNPSNGAIFISNPSKVKLYIQFISIEGNVFKSEYSENAECEFDCSSFKSGFYYIKISYNEYELIAKVVFQTEI